MKYVGLILVALVVVGWFVLLGFMVNYFFKKASRPGGGFFSLVYMFAGAFSFLAAEVLIVLISYFTGFETLLCASFNILSCP